MRSTGLPRVALAAAGWLALLGCGPAVALPAQPPGGADAITEIVVERLCFGCTDAGRVVMRRDGAATRTRPGNARQGTAAEERVAVVDAAAFAALARAIDRAGFFQLSDEYADPAIADAPAVVTTVVAGAQRKTITDRGARGPAALRDLEQAILRAADALSWKDR